VLLLASTPTEISTIDVTTVTLICVGRHRQPEIKQCLLAACTDHVLAHGLPDRLEPLVVATGTSGRMLLYHFGTRDDLLHEVLREARARQVRAWSDLLQARPEQPYLDTLHDAWRIMSGPEGRAYLRVFSPLHDAAGEPLWPGFRRAATTDWLGPLATGLASIGKPELATAVLAVIRGLLMDLDATGDTDRTDRAFRDVLAALAA